MGFLQGLLIITPLGLGAYGVVLGGKPSFLTGQLGQGRGQYRSHRRLTVGYGGIGLVVALVLSIPMANSGANARELSGVQPVSSLSPGPHLASAKQIQPLPDLQRYALGLVNQHRQAQGLNSLSLNPLLNQMAMAHAEDMLQRNFFDHRTPEGTTPHQRYIQAGGNAKIGIGENIFTFENPKLPGLSLAMVQFFQQEWMKSPGHRQNILYPDFVEFGYGIVQGPRGKVFAVQVFATD